MRVKSFRDLLVWQKAMCLAREIYSLTTAFPKEELFGLSSQMRRAAVSIPSNIAEGQGQLTDKAFVLFLSRARGSLCELGTQTELAANLGFVPRAELDRLLTSCDEVGRMIHGLMRSMTTRSDAPAPHDSSNRPNSQQLYPANRSIPVR